MILHYIPEYPGELQFRKTPCGAIGNATTVRKAVSCKTCLKALKKIEAKEIIQDRHKRRLNAHILINQSLLAIIALSVFTVFLVTESKFSLQVKTILSLVFLGLAYRLGIKVALLEKFMRQTK